MSDIRNLPSRRWSYLVHMWKAHPSRSPTGICFLSRFTSHCQHTGKSEDLTCCVMIALYLTVNSYFYFARFLSKVHDIPSPMRYIHPKKFFAPPLTPLHKVQDISN